MIVAPNTLVRLRKESTNVINEAMASAVVWRRSNSKHILYGWIFALLKDLLKYFKWQRKKLVSAPTATNAGFLKLLKACFCSVPNE